MAEVPWGTQYAGYRAAGPGQDLLSLRQFPVSVLDAGAQRRVRQPHACARLGAARRRAHDVLLHLVEARGFGHVAAAAGLQGRHADRRHHAAATRCCPTPPTGSAAGGWRRTRGNDWGIDRAAQQSNTIYSGIDGIHLQDQAITESMGEIVDHTLEHLAPSDQMITRTRRRLLMAARALRDQGTSPPGVEDARGLSRRPQRLLRQRRQEPLAGGLRQTAGCVRASGAEPPAGGGVAGCPHTRNSCVYLVLISSASRSTSAASSRMTLIWLRGTRPGGSLISACAERRPPTTTLSCCASTVNDQL